MQIKQAAAQCGLTEKAIRLYEEKGLITPTYTDKNGRQFRDYNEETVSRLQTIAILRKSFFSIEQIAEILDHPENIPAVFASYRAELQKQYADLKPLIIRAGEIDAASLSDVNAVSDAMTAPAPHGISDEALPSVHFRVWDEGTSTDEREKAYARYQKWIARWEKRYAAELAVRNVFERPFWKWIALSAVILSVTGWYLYTQPFVTDIDLTLNGYEIVLPNEKIIPVDVDSLPDSDAVYALDLKPYIPESDGIPRSMTLRGEYHHYLFKPDQFRGELILDSYEIHVSDRNGVLRGGQPTPEECREFYGENFVITELEFGPGYFWQIYIEKAFGGRMERDSDHSTISDLMIFGQKEAPQFIFATSEMVSKTSSTTRYTSTDRYLVFPADSPTDALYRYYDTVWRADQAYYHDVIKPYEQGEED